MQRVARSSVSVRETQLVAEGALGSERVGANGARGSEKAGVLSGGE